MKDPNSTPQQHECTKQQHCLIYHWHTTFNHLLKPSFKDSAVKILKAIPHHDKVGKQAINVAINPFLVHHTC